MKVDIRTPPSIALRRALGKAHSRSKADGLIVEPIERLESILLT